MKKLPTTTAEYRAAESEASFQKWVINTARDHGWLTAHVRDSRGQDATGLPDLVMARAGVVLLLELKAEGGTTTKAQDVWLAASGNHLYRPSDRPELMGLLA